MQLNKFFPIGIIIGILISYILSSQSAEWLNPWTNSLTTGFSLETGMPATRFRLLVCFDEEAPEQVTCTASMTGQDTPPLCTGRVIDPNSPDTEPSPLCPGRRATAFFYAARGNWTGEVKVTYLATMPEARFMWEKLQGRLLPCTEGATSSQCDKGAVYYASAWEGREVSGTCRTENEQRVCAVQVARSDLEPSPP